MSMYTVFITHLYLFHVQYINYSYMVLLQYDSQQVTILQRGLQTCTTGLIILYKLYIYKKHNFMYMV